MQHKKTQRITNMHHNRATRTLWIAPARARIYPVRTALSPGRRPGERGLHTPNSSYRPRSTPSPLRTRNRTPEARSPPRPPRREGAAPRCRASQFPAARHARPPKTHHQQPPLTQDSPHSHPVRRSERPLLTLWTLRRLDYAAQPPATAMNGHHQTRTAAPEHTRQHRWTRMRWSLALGGPPSGAGERAQRELAALGPGRGEDGANSTEDRAKLSPIRGHSVNLASPYLRQIAGFRAGRRG